MSRTLQYLTTLQHGRNHSTQYYIKLARKKGFFFRVNSQHQDPNRYDVLGATFGYSIKCKKNTRDPYIGQRTYILITIHYLNTCGYNISIKSTNIYNMSYRDRYYYMNLMMSFKYKATTSSRLEGLSTYVSPDVRRFSAATENRLTSTNEVHMYIHGCNYTQYEYLLMITHSYLSCKGFMYVMFPYMGYNDTIGVIRAVSKAWEKLVTTD